MLSFIIIFVSISGFLNHKSVKESFLGKTTTSLTIFSIHLSTIVSPECVAKALFLSIKISL
ncbi:MAG: hypothetical protein LBF15_02060 [Candidatus Peribacteria bacterium]|nr:hypothetical protein [Candidatus Peribacteria bacterium]